MISRGVWAIISARRSDLAASGTLWSDRPNQGVRKDQHCFPLYVAHTDYLYRVQIILISTRLPLLVVHYACYSRLPINESYYLAIDCLLRRYIIIFVCHIWESNARPLTWLSYHTRINHYHSFHLRHRGFYLFVNVDQYKAVIGPIKLVGCVKHQDRRRTCKVALAR